MKKLVLIVLTMLSLNAYAATEYIVNGTFNDDPTEQTNAQTGWVLVSPDDLGYFQFNQYNEGAITGSPSTLSQVVKNAYGALTLSFDYVWNDGFQTVKWNNAVVDSVSSATTKTHYVFTVIGTGSDTLSFLGENNSSYNMLSNVSLTASAVPAVPEPQTYAMLLLGMGIIGAVVRRRKQT